MRNKSKKVLLIFFITLFCLVFFPYRAFSQNTRKPVGKTRRSYITKKKAQQTDCSSLSRTVTFGVSSPVPQAISSNQIPEPKTNRASPLNGNAITLVTPPYPPAAHAVRASGAVNVQVLIDEKGNVVTASAVSGHPLLRQASEQAALQSKFSPTILSDCPVKVSGIVVYNFVPQ